MGKAHKAERLNKKRDGKYYFDILVRVHGQRPHTETYSILDRFTDEAFRSGYFKERNKYLDWKPLDGQFKFGGIYHVSKFTSDDTYVYAHIGNNSKPSFSLPKYLFKENPVQNEILVGYREYKKEGFAK